MGLLFTLVYFLYMIISPSVWLPWLATITVQPFVAALAALCTMPRFMTRSPFRVASELTLFAIVCVMMVVSPALHGWFGGVPPVLITILSAACYLFLVPLNCDTQARRRIFAITMLGAMLVLAIPGIREYHSTPESSKFVLFEGIESSDSANPEEGQATYRLKAQGLIDDPNDYAQMLLVTLALSFMWWGRSMVKNILFVLLPSAVLLYAVYLTHSRGALVAIAVMTAVAFRRKLRLVGSATLAAAVAGGLVVANFTAGREIGISSGVDRLELWSEGWEMLKQAPIIGQGFGGYSDTIGATAHNSFLLVAVDLGLIVYFIWVSIFVVSFLQLARVAQPADARPADPVLRRHALCLEVALTAFLATSWFLSRAYQPTSFLLVGLVGGLVYEEHRRLPAAQLAPPWRKCAYLSLGAGIAALVAINILGRMRLG